MRRKFRPLKVKDLQCANVTFSMSMQSKIPSLASMSWFTVPLLLAHSVVKGSTLKQICKELRIFSLRQNTALSNVLSPSHRHPYLTVVDQISNTLMTYRTSQCGPNIIMVPVSMMPSYSACLNRI